MKDSQYSIEEKLRRVQEELSGLRQELEDTNRGVLALYAELEEKAAHLRIQADILATINDAVVVFDLSFRITSWNHGAERIFGWKEEEVLGMLGKDLLHSELSEEERAAIQQCLKDGNPVVNELVQYTREDQQVIASINTIPLRNAQGEIIGYVSVYQDITARKRAETELQTYASRLERSNRDLEDFAYIASHDLKEPLRKVLSFSNLLVERAGSRLTQEDVDYLDRMRNASERMQRMIDDLLTYSRVSTQAQPHRLVDLAQVVNEVLTDLEIRIKQNQGKVQVGSLPKIEAEPLQMHHLFQNLIGNALKFHKKDIAPVVKVGSKIVTDNMVEITVEDNGIGFPMEQIDTIFQPFRRLHGRSEYEGSGIGLSICRKIVERHDGTISARSSPGEGSVFTVKMPFRQG